MIKGTLTILFCFALSANIAAQPLTALTYNIRYATENDGADAWSKRRDFLAAQLRFHKPDVFGVQEALKSQLEYLLEQLPGYTCVGVGRDDGREGGEYSALFYRTDRFRALESGTFWLSETPDKPSKAWDAALPRICTWALLEDTASGQKLRVFNTHFDHIGQVARQNSADLILKKIAKMDTGAVPAILMGDLNTEPGTAPIEQITESMRDAHDYSLEPPFGPEGTFNGFEFKEPVTRRIDYIFVSPGLEVLQYAVLSDSRNCHYPSDHLPVLVRLR